MQHKSNINIIVSTWSKREPTGVQKVMSVKILLLLILYPSRGPSRTWSYGKWIYNYQCNQCLSSLTLWVWIPLRRGVLNTTLCDKVCQWLAPGQLFSPGTPVTSTNKTDRHNIAEILLKIALKTIILTLSLTSVNMYYSRGTASVLLNVRHTFINEIILDNLP